MIIEKELCDKIIGCAIRVHKVLGPGYLEKVYERALVIEFNHAGINCESQVPLQIEYRNEIVGEYLADIVVEGMIIFELKSCTNISSIHKAQLINYLTATKKRIGYIINFGSTEKLEFKRIVK